MTRDEFLFEHGEALVFTEDWEGARFKYGYVNRPFAMAHQPKGFIIGSVDGEFRDRDRGIRHGTIEYPFRLSDHEVTAFELVDMTIPPVPQEVKSARFGCGNCLCSGCECIRGGKYSPLVAFDGSPSCGGYIYYD